jgi:uncharacterized protein (TIGR04141 family)
LPEKKPSLTFHVRLLRKSIASYHEALKDPEIEQTPLQDDLPFAAALFVKPLNERQPWWVDFLSTGIVGPLEELTNISTGALLFVIVDSRIFAVSFGYGHALLKLGSYEPGFGLRVVLNSINPDRLQSLDRRTIDDTPSLTRKQVSQLSPIESFGIDIETDVLKAVAGIPEEKTLAKRLSGADALTIMKPIGFAELGAMCSKLLEVYKSDQYKKSGRFDWIDHLEDVRDPNMVDDLDDRLLEAIAKDDVDNLRLAAPEIIDWDTTLTFHYSHEGHGTSHDELDIRGLLDSFDDPLDVEIPFLKTRYVRVTLESDGTTIDKWSIYDCLVFETELGGYRYILTDGKWYRVSKSFVDHVQTYVKDNVPVSAIPLPAPTPNETEGAYNDRVAKENSEYLLMDKKMVLHGGGSSAIEFCDILTKQRQFLHVKKRSASSKMSHLLAQGSVAAQAFVGDDEFRKKARARVAKESKDFRDLVPLKRPLPADYEVVYVLLGGKSADPLSLPFFTLLHLRQHAKLLNALGFQVSIRLVPDA